MSKYDWSGVPYRVKFIATEIVAGKYLTWGYKKKPSIAHIVWLADADDYGWDKPVLIGVDIFKGNWQDSLEERPK